MTTKTTVTCDFCGTAATTAEDRTRWYVLFRYGNKDPRDVCPVCLEKLRRAA